MTLQLPPGKVAQAPPVQVRVQQSPAAVQGLPTSEQTLSEHVPLLQLFRQQSLLLLHDSPLAWQTVAELQTVPSQVPPQQGRPETQADPSATQVPSGPPSGPPSRPTFPPPSGPPTDRPGAVTGTDRETERQCRDSQECS